ncbi:MAG: dihydroneopterin aldolase [Paludibacteraceae bacterium]|nr:dihydroneopterin aldolase [Paludibacteraceae bacterium]
MGKIILEKMQFYAYHGFFDEEQLVGANYELTLALDLDISLPGRTDELTDTLNYQAVYDVVKEQMDIKSRLVEHVAQRIIDRLRAEFPQIQHIELSLSKLNPPLGGQVERVTIQLSTP